MEQTIFNIVLTLVGALGAWVLKSITEELKARRQADHDLRNKLQSIELLVAGQYVRKDDLEKFGDAIFKRLDKMEERITSSRT